MEENYSRIRPTIEFATIEFATIEVKALYIAVCTQHQSPVTPELI
jgi:hypothetical protein